MVGSASSKQTMIPSPPSSTHTGGSVDEEFGTVGLEATSPPISFSGYTADQSAVLTPTEFGPDAQPNPSSALLDDGVDDFVLRDGNSTALTLDLPLNLDNVDPMSYFWDNIFR